MRILSGVTDQYIYFVAVDATDLKTREAGLSSFTVVRSRNGAADATYTTPTVAEIDATTMPGVYALLLDEDMTIDAGDDSQEVALHITHAGMAPVTRTFELYRAKITAGNTLDVSSTGAAGIDLNNIELPVGAVPAFGIAENGTLQSATASTAVLRAGTSVADDLPNNFDLYITGGTGASQARLIVDWVSATDTATVNPNWTTTPDATSTYIVRAAAPAPTSSSYVPAVNAVLIEGADPSDTIRDAVVDDATRIDASALNTASVTTIPAILVDTGTTLDAKIDAIDDLLDTELPALTTAVADLPTNAELATALGTADDAVLAQVALVKAQTDKFANLPVFTSGGTGGQGFGAP